MVAEHYQPIIPVDMCTKQAQSCGPNGPLQSERLPAENVDEASTQHDQLRPRILMVDADGGFVRQFTALAQDLGYAVTVSSSAAEAYALLQEPDAFDLLVVDPQTSVAGDIDLIKYATERLPDIPLMAVTYVADIQSAVEVLKLGAVEYLIKPIRSAIISESLRAIFDKTLSLMELRHLRRSLADRYNFSGILSKTPAMHAIFERIRLVSATDVTVLLEGETGTGKDLVATAIHMQSPRKLGPLLSLNCAGVPDSLLESELFGYERGAFTDATHTRLGKIELADQGTLFLDEIESMSLAMQAKLLLVLQSRKIQRLGSSRTQQVDMRVIAASNIPLHTLVANGSMRADFYFRINVLPLRLLSLRERRADIPLLVQDYIARHPMAQRRRIRGVTPEVLTEFLQYPWPGNVRELQNVLERAIVLAQGPLIEDACLSPQASVVPEQDTRQQITLPLREWLNGQEEQYLCRQLYIAGGNSRVAAEYSGIDPRTFFRKLRRYGISARSFRTKKGERHESS